MSRIIKTVFTVTVLHQAHGSDNGAVENMGLADVAAFIDDGAGIGDLTVTSNTVVDVNQVRSELLAIGNDGEFFDVTELEGYDFGPLPVIITLDRENAKPGERASDFVGRFASEEIASSFLSLSATIDPDALHAGRYGICTVAKTYFCDDEPVVFTSSSADSYGPVDAVVMRLLTPAEADAEVGPMYRVVWTDGAESDAFADELAPVATELPDGIDI